MIQLQLDTDWNKDNYPELLQDGYFRCFKCGKVLPKVVYKWIPHHIQYPVNGKKEIIVDCCNSCHKKIHHRIRKNNLCPLSIKETKRLSVNSSMRRNRDRYQHDFMFYNTVDKNVVLYERIRYEKNTGNVGADSYFIASHRKKLLYIDI